MSTNLMAVNNKVIVADEDRAFLEEIATEIRLNEVGTETMMYMAIKGRGASFQRAQDFCEKKNIPFAWFIKEFNFSKRYVYYCLSTLKLEGKEEFFKNFTTRQVFMLAALPQEIIDEIDSNGITLPDGKYITGEEIQKMPPERFKETFRLIAKSNHNKDKEIEETKKSFDKEKKVMKEELEKLQDKNKNLEDNIKEYRITIEGFKADDDLALDANNAKVYELAKTLEEKQKEIEELIANNKFSIKKADETTKAKLYAILESVLAFINQIQRAYLAELPMQIMRRQKQQWEESQIE